MDLFVSVFGGKSLLYHNEGTTNHWIKAVLHPTKSNGSAIGAKVRITAAIQGKSITQIREVGTGDGLNGNSQEVLFGLGDANALEKISVEWPSGAVSFSPTNTLPLIYIDDVRRVSRVDIYEPQPLVLNVATVTRDKNSKITNVGVVWNGDQTAYYYSGKPFRDFTVQRRAYGIEVSNDSIHWQKYVAPGGTYFDGGQVDLSEIGPGIDPSRELLIRAQDLGFVRHTED